MPIINVSNPLPRSISDIPIYLSFQSNIRVFCFSYYLIRTLTYITVWSNESITDLVWRICRLIYFSNFFISLPSCGGVLAVGIQSTTVIPVDFL